MSLIAQIQQANLQARKAKQTKDALLYSTLLGECLAKGKNDGNRETTDAEVVAIAKKFINNINETLVAILSSSSDACTDYNLLREKELLSAFIPAQLSELELRTISAAHKTEGLPAIMKFLKDNHVGLYDGKLASSIAKEVLAG